MKIIPIGPNQIRVETDNGHEFDIYGLVGGGIELHPAATVPVEPIVVYRSGGGPPGEEAGHVVLRLKR